VDFATALVVGFGIVCNVNVVSEINVRCLLLVVVVVRCLNNGSVLSKFVPQQLCVSMYRNKRCELPVL
jgi:hypothetical protein